MRWDLSDEVAAGEERGQQIVLIAMEREVLLHPGDVGVGNIAGVEEADEVAIRSPCSVV